ncbi:S8 family serine peptidase [Cohnella fermenti]|uniref:Peptidase S8/S53 domain-containing protein n=1 Tax=Cohnella fermenti TaxID=2565925 RepID=A0A4S4C1Z0_9BACL|nr:S8 family serine peptidase [Cohnella fermenti]THF81684.1 hypothetical protein E6C55_08115 [Cohnella fermenti]
MKRLGKSIQYVTLFSLLLTSVFSDLSITAKAAPASSNTKAEKTERHKTQLLVKYKFSADGASIEASVRTRLKLEKLEVKKRNPRSGTELLQIGSQDDLNSTIAELRKNPNVEYVQPNYMLYSTAIADARFEEQWGLSNSGQNVGQAGISGIDIGARAAWETTMGASSVMVGVLDTGIEIEHPDLSGNIYTNPNEVPDNGIDDDGNGYIDDVHGFDFINRDSSIYDSASDDKHGTHVAGIIAAQANTDGIRGVAPNVTVLPLKFISNGAGYTSDAIEAIEYAEKMGASIINMSFGGSDANPALEDAMAASGMLFVAAAGNNGDNSEVKPVYPASFDIPNLLSVTAIDNKGKLASFADYGESVDVAAPGVSILSTVPGSGYAFLSGTSMAAPFVAGIAALIKSMYADLTSSSIAERIKNGVQASSALAGKVGASGWVNAIGALEGQGASSNDNGSSSATGNSILSEGNDTLVVTLAVDVSSDLMEQIHYGEEGVNVATGNYGRTETDISVTSPGFVVNLSRTYNSRDDRTTSSMGRGWTFGFEGSVKDDTTSPTKFKVVRLPSGGAQVFVKNSDGTYTANDSHSTLVKQSDGTHVLTTADQYTYGFNTAGYLTWMQDRNGNKVTIASDAAGKVRSVMDTVGRKFIINYNAAGYITSIVDPIGRKVTYTYDSLNRLWKVNDPSGKDTRVYMYDNSNYLTAIKNGAGNLVESVLYSHSTGTDQHKVTRTIDENGHTVQYTYDSTNKMTKLKNIDGLLTVKWYDTAGYVVKSQDPEGRLTLVEYFTDSSSYNKYGEVKSVTDRYGNKTQYERDSNGNVTKLINPDGNSRAYVFDSKNNLISEQDETGRLTYYIYDASQTLLLKKVQPLNGTDAYSDKADQTRFAITQYQYYSEAEDAKLGHKAKKLLRSETDPEGGKTVYAYDSQGNATSVTDPDGNITTRSYNGVGWLTTQISAEGYRTEHEYDSIGHVVKTIGDEGETTFNEFNNDGQQTRQATPNQYKNNMEGTRWTYDTNGQVSTVTDALGYTTSYTYDVYGNVASVTQPNGSITLYQYDAMNRIKKKSFQSNAGSEAYTLETYAYTVLSNGNTQYSRSVYLNEKDIATTTVTYDVNGREVVKQQPDGTEATTSYYANGSVRSVTDARGNSSYYEYDGLNRVTGTWSPLDGGKYTYKGYTYDLAGRVILTSTGKDPVNAFSVPARNRTIWTSTVYQANGTIASTQSSDGAETIYTYDADNRLTREDHVASADETLTTEYVYNDLGKPLAVKKHVRAGDLDGNAFDDDTDTVLTTRYSYDLEGNLLSTVTPDGVESVMTYDALGRLTSTSKEGVDENGLTTIVRTSSTYDGQGHVLSSMDGRGNMTSYVYNAAGNLTKQVDSAGGVHLFAYDRASRKVAEVSPGNYKEGELLSKMSRTVYTYDIMGRTQAVTEYYAEKTLSASYAWMETEMARVTQAFKYDENGNVIKKLDGEGYLAGTGTTIDARIQSGYGTILSYNAANLLVTELDPVGAERGLKWTTKISYDGAGRQVSVTNANGVVFGNRLDDAGRTTEQTLQSGTAAPERVLHRYVYDAIGRKLNETDGNGNVTTYTYNAFNQTRTVVEQGDDSIPELTLVAQYDAMGRVTSQSNSASTMNRFAYDSYGRILSETESGLDGTDAIVMKDRYDANGNRRYHIDGNGYETEYRYDSLNRLTMTLTSVTDVAGNTTVRTDSQSYDANGNVIEKKDWLGNKQQFVYDARNRLIETKDAAGIVIEKLVYNANDSQLASYDALNRATSFAYDRNNRQVSLTDPAGNTTSQAYDNVGNQASETDGNGNITRYKYDEQGRLISVVNALGEITAYTYDLNGNKLTQRDGTGHVMTYEYNAVNKLVRTIYPGGRTGQEGSYTYDLSKVESMTYTVTGQLETRQDRNGNTTAYVYDAHDRLLSTTVTGPELTSDESERQIRYTYDKNGSQLSVTDSTGTTRRTYDSLGRVVSKSVPGIGTSKFQYDVTTGLTTGYYAEITTDAKNNSTTKVYNNVGRLKYVINGTSPTATATVTYEYFSDGSQQTVTYANTTKESYTYKTNGLLDTLKNYKGSTLLDQYVYTYDNAGNQKTKTETVNGVAKGTTSYAYDVLNRLQIVTEPSGKKTEYAFDGAGNRITERVTEGSQFTIIDYTYDEQNRLLATTQASLSGETERVDYTYDNNGNMISKSTEERKKTDPMNLPEPTFGIFVYGQVTDNPRIVTVLEGVARYEYDVFNQLIRVSTGNGGASYQYNGEGLRVRKTGSDGETTNYMYEYDKVVLETDGNGKQTARNLYGLNLATRTVGTATYSYLYNGHADVTSLTDASGVVQSTYSYDAFGNIVSQTGTINSPFRYAGYQYDDESDLYYLNARYYDPKIARFLSEDTYRGQANDPLSLNMYTYVHNEPMMYWDPTGHAEANTNATVTLRTIVEDAYGGQITKWDNQTKTATVNINGQVFTIKADGVTAGIVSGKVIINTNTLDQLYNSNQNNQTTMQTSATTETISAKIYSNYLKGNIIERTVANDYKPTQEIAKIIKEVVDDKNITLSQVESIVTVLKFAQAVQNSSISSMTTEQYTEAIRANTVDPFAEASLNLLPIVGNVKSIGDLIYGEDIVNGEVLSTTDKWTTAVFVIIPQLRLLRKGKKIEEALEEVVPGLRGTGNSGSLKMNLQLFAEVNLDVKPQANSTKLQNFINSLYKGQGNPNQIGNGTTMDSIRYEVHTGNPVEGKFHSQKGQEFMNGINKLISSGTLDAQDEVIAKAIVQDIANALAGK